VLLPAIHSLSLVFLQTREVLGGTSVTCGDIIEARMAGLAFVATFQAVDGSNNMATKVCANVAACCLCAGTSSAEASVIC
jgi:hypothetical protein